MNIAPAVLEIDELTQENSFVKNLFGKVIADGEFLKSAGGLIIGVAAAGVIPSFTQAVSVDTWRSEERRVGKIAATYKEYQEKKREILQKDMYFYYKAGKLLK